MVSMFSNHCWNFGFILVPWVPHGGFQFGAFLSGAACTLARAAVGGSWNIPACQAPTITPFAKIHSDGYYGQRELSASTNLTCFSFLSSICPQSKTQMTTIPHSLTWQTNISFLTSVFFFLNSFSLFFFPFFFESARLLPFVLPRHSFGGCLDVSGGTLVFTRFVGTQPGSNLYLKVVSEVELGSAGF